MNQIDLTKAPDPDDRAGSGEPGEDDARSRSLSLGGSPGVSLGGFSKTFGFLTSVRDEMRKVSWPTRRMVITETVVVVIVVIFFTCLIVGLDHVFALIFNAALFGK